ncbi:MAG: hypothetical protein PWP24_863 [Clostridiales bacterium]|nr:hypothetical protein [Clostridiales bacterium]
MCGRYFIDDETSKEIDKILKKLEEREQASLIKKTGDIRPTDYALGWISKKNHMEPTALKWGFANPNGKNLIINARVETAASKRLFREAMQNRRCIIPASGFYEWNANKEKFSFSSKDASMLYFAGIFDFISSVPSFVILTTQANQSVADIHERMPLLLKKEQLEPWLFDFEKAEKISLQVPEPLRCIGENVQMTLDL